MRLCNLNPNLKYINEISPMGIYYANSNTVFAVWQDFFGEIEMKLGQKCGSKLSLFYVIHFSMIENQNQNQSNQTKILINYLNNSRKSNLSK